MMVKVFTPNARGKIEFTKDEIECLLNEVWRDGYAHGRQNQYYWSSPTWGNGTITVTNTEPPHVTYTTVSAEGTA